MLLPKVSPHSYTNWRCSYRQPGMSFDLHQEKVSLCGEGIEQTVLLWNMTGDIKVFFVENVVNKSLRPTTEDLIRLCIAQTDF